MRVLPEDRAQGDRLLDSPWCTMVLATISGLAWASGYPPFSVGLVPWLALAPLFIACARCSPRRAAVAGMCWTLAVAAGVAWFLPGMLSSYFALRPALTWIAAFVLVVALHGVWIATFGAWVAWMSRRGAASPVTLASGWLAVEFVRAHGAFGSPWALAAYAELGWPPAVQIADVAGAYGIGWLVAAVNATLAACVAPTVRGSRPWRSAALVAAAVTVTSVYGGWRLGERFGDGAPIRVAAIQGDGAEKLARYLSSTAERTGTALVVWPEHAVDTYLEEPSPTRDAVLRVGRDTGADVVLGGPQFEAAAGGTRYHNSAYLVRDGRIAARYDKHRLVPVAEDDRFAWLLGDRGTTYTPGPARFVLPTSTLRAGMLLCVEAMFPDLARRAALQGAEVLVNLSNDAWFGHPTPARHQLAIASLRAVENRRYLIRAATTGFSAVIDPHGRTLALSEFGTSQALDAVVHASHARTPYQRWGDALSWLTIAGVAAASLRQQSRRSFG